MGQNLGMKLKDLKTCNVLVLGLDNSGKSSIVNCVKTRNETSGQRGGRNRIPGKTSISPTIGFRLERVTVHEIAMTLIDMSGQGRYRNLWEYYYKECDAIVFVVDSSDRRRLPVAYEEKDRMLLHPEIINRTIPILYFSNKMDRTGALHCDELVQALNTQRFAGRKPWKVFCSNAVTGTGVTAGFEWLADQLAIKPSNGRLSHRQ